MFQAITCIITILFSTAVLSQKPTDREILVRAFGDMYTAVNACDLGLVRGEIYEVLEVYAIGETAVFSQDVLRSYAQSSTGSFYWEDGYRENFCGVAKTIAERFELLD